MLASTYFPGQLPAKYRKRRASLTSVFGMGTGGPSPQSTPTLLYQKVHIYKTAKLSYIILN